MYGRKKTKTYDQYEMEAYERGKRTIIKREANKTGYAIAEKELLGEQKQIDRRLERSKTKRKKVQGFFRSSGKVPKWRLNV